MSGFGESEKRKILRSADKIADCETPKETVNANRTEVNSTAKKDLLKTNKKSKKKQLFAELTFVEQHVDTFYIGLNENWQSAANPKKAKTLKVDENVDELVKNWVHKMKSS